MEHKCFILSLRNPKSVYGIHYNNGTKVLGFNSKSEAIKCKRAISYYRFKYGYWPLQKQLVKQQDQNKHTLTDIYNMVELSYTDSSTVVNFCAMQNVGAIFCESFNIEDSSFHIKGSQMEPPENMPIYTKNLENMYLI